MSIGVSNGITTIEADSREELEAERSRVQASFERLDVRLGKLIEGIESKKETGLPVAEALVARAEKMRVQATGLVERLDLLDFALGESAPASGAQLPGEALPTRDEDPF
jgi:hypothetical protein